MTSFTQRSVSVLVLACAVLAGACGSGGGSGNTGGTGVVVVPTTIASIGGRLQTAGCAAGIVPDTPTVVVRSATGAPLAGQTVSFSVVGGGTISSPTRTTNNLGQAGVSWTLGTTGAQSVTATVGTLAPIVFTSSLAGSGAFCIELVYTSAPDPLLRTATENAAARWASIITGPVPNQPLNETSYDCAGLVIPAMQRTVKSLVIYVELAPIPSSTPGLITLGQAGPCWIRDAGGLTVVGALKLNSEYLINNLSATAREDVVLHEMGHVLGFGTLWEPITGVTGMRTLLQTPAPTGDPKFVGAAAAGRYVLAGAATGSAEVPVEFCGGGGTINGHWREASTSAGVGFGIELMTGFISAPSGQRNPLSAVTIGSMGDLGYTVSFTAADTYTAVGQACPAPLMYAPPEASGLVHAGGQWVSEQLIKPSGIVGRDGRVRPIYR